MISVYFSGRTGNQLFQYAFVRKLYKLRGSKDKLVFNSSLVQGAGKSENGFVDTFNDFNVVEHTIDSGNLVLHNGSLSQKAIWLAFNLYTRLLGHITEESKQKWFRYFTSHGLLFTTNTDNDYNSLTAETLEKVLTQKNIIVYGKFENPKFFNGLKPELEKEFTPLHQERNENKDLYKVIRNSNSVCVHIRRGDFLNSTFKKDFYVCDDDYFKSAIKEIKQKVDSPTLIFFSNDIKWVKENIKTDLPSYYESGNDPVWETLRLMYSCKHFVMSNSTLSWWAQYLSRNPEKVVISPDHWYNNRDMNEHARLLQPEFIKISVAWH